ncbi:MAG TPA: hypothetical protein VGQ66_00550 [Candidatus Limnocylindria bacterium]|nr:hypothetical protein [Candidatus Limnocylindria bacterium]
MFGRRSRESREAADREQSRRALFEELAKRPPDICPFLGLATSQTEYHEGFTREHRCYAFGDPVELSAEQQERVCLGRGYGNCPRYLRGVLVIPTDELEALRRPLPPVTPPAPPVTPPPAAARAGGQSGRRRGLSLLIGAILLLAVGGTVGALVLFRGPGVGIIPSPSASPSATPNASASIAASGEPSASPQPSNQTPFPETPKPDPTPQPGDTFQGYEVTVLEGENTLFEVDSDGNIVREEIAHFSRFSKAPVDRILAPNGLLHWRTSDGFFTGLSYIHEQSGAFLIRAVYKGSDGELRYIVLDDEDV